jgi:hypothetical protein
VRSDRYQAAVFYVVNDLLLYPLTKVEQTQHAPTKRGRQTPAEPHPQFVFIVITDPTETKVAPVSVLFVGDDFINLIKNGR